MIWILLVHRFSQLRLVDVEMGCKLMWLLQSGDYIPASAWILPHGPGMRELHALADGWEYPSGSRDIATRLKHPPQETVKHCVKGLQLREPVEKEGSSHWQGKGGFGSRDTDSD